MSRCIDKVGVVICDRNGKTQDILTSDHIAVISEKNKETYYADKKKITRELKEIFTVEKL